MTGYDQCALCSDVSIHAPVQAGDVPVSGKLLYVIDVSIHAPVQAGDK